VHAVVLFDSACLIKLDGNTEGNKNCFLKGKNKLWDINKYIKDSYFLGETALTISISL
jgi:hypothetical protein